MKTDLTRLTHLRDIARDKRGAFRAASDARADQREKLLGLQRDRARFIQNYGEQREPTALAALDARIASARTDLDTLSDRTDELAQTSSQAAQTFQAALEYAQGAGLPLPDDLRPRAFGSPAVLPSRGAI